MERKILVLGAGFYNINIFKKLKEAGFYTIAVDGNPDAEAAPFANEFINLDFSNAELLLNYCKLNLPDAILPLNDWGTRSAAIVSELLGLNGISPQAALNATDKGYMRDAWRDFGLPNPEYFVFSDITELQNGIEEIGYPCVIKPTDSGGSGRGISVLSGPEDIDWAFNFAIPFVRNNRLICEGFVEGTELTIESICINEEVTILAISDKEKPNLKTRVATSLNYPANITIEQEQLVKSVVTKAVLALGINIGMAHTEVILNGMNVKLVETGARGGGGHIYHTIIEQVSGINAPALCADVLCGSKPNNLNILKRGAVYRFFNPPYGILKEVQNMETVKHWDGILDIGLVKKPGDLVGDLKNSLERAGHVITAGADRQEATELANKVVSYIKFLVD